ncbi:MAG: hypothetical protein IIZ39_09425 [Blautia sp.]|nr:hypothetical protein [Blautia sp.]
MDCKRFDRICLMLEAILIVIDLAIFGKARVGMICYWSIVALYHLTDIVQGRKNDGKA